MPVRDGQDDRLDRGEPEREGSGVVLDQDGDEPLEAAENRAMDDHRAVLGVVGADVFQIETLRHHERGWRRRKERLDAAAAAIILQDYLDERRDAREANPAG